MNDVDEIPDEPPFEYEDIPGFVPVQPDHEAEEEALNDLDEIDLGGDE